MPDRDYSKRIGASIRVILRSAKQVEDAHGHFRVGGFAKSRNQSMQYGILRRLVDLDPPCGGEGLGHLIFVADQRVVHHVPWISLQIPNPARNISEQLR